MKILFIAELKETDICGVTTHIKNLMLGLNELGHETDFVSMSSIPLLIRKVFILLPITLMKLISVEFRWMWPFIFMEIYMNIYLIYWQLLHKYDVINVEGPTSFHSTYSLRKIFKIPVVLTAHSYSSDILRGRGIKKGSFTERYFNSKVQRALDLSPLIITVDSRIREYVASEYNIPKEKIKRIINSVDVDEFKPRKEKYRFREIFKLPKNKYIILCPRRLVGKNGVIYAALACRYLKEKLFNNFVLVYTGRGGPEYEKIIDITEKDQVSKNILFLDTVPHEKIKYLYNASNIVIIPSVNYFGLEEATSISALEAMSSGIPVIASNIGGLKEIIISNKTGFLIEEKNPKLLANKIIEVCNMDTYDITKNAQEYVLENLSCKEGAKKFLECYNQVKKTI